MSRVSTRVIHIISEEQENRWNLDSIVPPSNIIYSRSRESDIYYLMHAKDGESKREKIYYVKCGFICNNIFFETITDIVDMYASDSDGGIILGAAERFPYPSTTDLNTVVEYPHTIFQGHKVYSCTGAFTDTILNGKPPGFFILRKSSMPGHITIDFVTNTMTLVSARFKIIEGNKLTNTVKIYDTVEDLIGSLEYEIQLRATKKEKYGPALLADGSSNPIYSLETKIVYEMPPPKLSYRITVQNVNDSQTASFLTGKEPGTFVFRKSSEIGKYALQYVNNDNGIKKILIKNPNPGVVIFGDMEKQFHSIDEIIYVQFKTVFPFPVEVIVSG